MNVAEKASTKLRPNTVDFERFRLRRFIESLGTEELDTRNAAIDLAGLAGVMEGNSKAVLFRSAGPEQAQLVGNVMGSRARIAAAFGVKPHELMKEVTRRLRNKPEIFEIPRAEAPCQAVVLTGADADVTKLPVHLQHGADGGPYISASIDYVIDPKTGFTNVGLRRLMLRSEHETGIDLVAPSDLKAIYESQRRGRQAHAGELRGRRASDRSRRRRDAAAGRRTRHRREPARGAVAGGQEHHERHPRSGRRRIRHRGLSRRARPCRAGGTVWRIPRLLRRGEAQSGFPRHGDHASRRRAVSDLDHRRQDARPHRHRAAFRAAQRNHAFGSALEAAVREPVAVYATTSSGGAFNIRVALRQRVPGEARNAISACMGALANCKNVYVVDPDVDIFSDEQMDWAMATRFQPDRDLIVMSGMRTLPLDPSLPPGSRVGAKAGYDLTWPFGAGRSPRSQSAGAADLRWQTLCLGRGGAGRRPQILRGADGRGGQPRRPRSGARVGQPAQQARARPRPRRALFHQVRRQISRAANKRTAGE